MILSEHPRIEFINDDCMDLLKGYADKQFELAIVDPPYGIGASTMNMGSDKNTDTFYAKKSWDVLPTTEYFVELFRVSDRQIIWGGNYFELRPSRGFAIWDKKIGDNDFAMCEYAWFSFDTSPKIFSMCGTHLTQGKRIHPTQKPVALYKWLLHNYAKPGDTILDTHGGSFSSAIACHQMGFDFVGIEKDIFYYEAAVKRFKLYESQGRLFEAVK